MFGLWYPHSLIKSSNPVFEYEMRRLRWPRHRHELRQYTRRVLFTVFGLFGIWWLSERSQRPWYRDAEGGILLLLGFLTFCMMFVTNIYYAMLTVGTVNREITSTQWDQLRLTALDGERILLAKYAILQIRAWRMTVVDMALRATAVALVFLAFMYSQMPSVSRGRFLSLTVDPFPLTFIGALTILGAAYILEPLWRMRTMVAIGMAVSTTVHTFTYAILAVLGSILLMYIGQMLILVSIGYVMGRIIFSTPLSSFGALCCVIPLTSLGMFYGSYAFYQAVRNRTMEHTLKVGLGGQRLRSSTREKYWS